MNFLSAQEFERALNTSGEEGVKRLTALGFTVWQHQVRRLLLVPLGSDGVVEGLWLGRVIPRAALMQTQHLRLRVAEPGLYVWYAEAKVVDQVMYKSAVDLPDPVSAFVYAEMDGWGL